MEVDTTSRIKESVPTDVIDSIVHLSFLGGTLGENSIPFVNNSKKSIVYSDDSSVVANYSSTKKLTLEGKNYPVKITTSTINDTICSISAEIETDIYSRLRDTYFAKYGEPSENYSSVKSSCTLRWKYLNQSISINYLKPQRVIYHTELKKNIYTNYYDFEGIHISYTDYTLYKRFEEFSNLGREIAKRETAIRDSISRIQRQEQSELEKQKRKEMLLNDANQL